MRVTGGERAAGECVAAVAALAERSPHIGLVNLYHYLWETVLFYESVSISIARDGLLRPVPGRLHPHRGLLAAGVGGVVQPQEGKGAAVAGAGGLVRRSIKCADDQFVNIFVCQKKVAAGER